MIRWFISLWLLAQLASACNSGETVLQESLSEDLSRDYFTFANVDEFCTRHLELDLEIDFARQAFVGRVVRHMDRPA